MTSLPFPVSIPSTHSHSHSHSHSTSTSDSPRLQTRALRGSISFIASRAKFLTQRARTTNLAVSLLALVCFTSLYYNASHTLANFVSQSDSSFIPPIPLSLSSTLTPAHQELDHMVMIPGHAIWQGCDASHSTQDKDWILQDFQKDGHHVTTYLKHLTKGAEIAVKDPKALLIFSGGQTRPDSTLTEAFSYLRLSKFGNVFTQFQQQQSTSDSSSSRSKGELKEFDRVTTEDYAMDSFQNVLFSIARFKEFTNHYPTSRYGMKSRRFIDLHRKALRWPIQAFEYIGIDNDGETLMDYEGEKENGYKPFERDLYGCGTFLGKKRRSRNPYRRFHGYHSSAPELRGLMEYCPEDGDKVYRGKLPWDV